MTSTPPPSADDDARLCALADEVRAELATAGLPVLPHEYCQEDDSASGVSVHVADGVWVDWHIRSPLSEAAQRAFVVGAFLPDGSEIHPAIRHFSVVKDALNDAMAAILRALGYEVRIDASNLAPGTLLVSLREPGPTWRDPAVPPLAGAAGYSPDVRVRLLAGDFAGLVTTVVSAVHQLPLQGPPLRYRVEHPSGTGELDVAPEDITLAEDDR